MVESGIEALHDIGNLVFYRVSHGDFASDPPISPLQRYVNSAAGRNAIFRGCCEIIGGRLPANQLLDCGVFAVVCVGILNRGLGLMATAPVTLRIPTLTGRSET